MKLLPFYLFLAAAARVLAVDPPLCPGAWTLVHLPDTQNYVIDPSRTEYLNRELTWIANHRVSRNIRMAVQVGDVVNNNDTPQWDRARGAFDGLNGLVPYALSSGNHDCGPGGSGSTRATQFTLPSRFGAGSPYHKQPTFGEYFQHPDDPPGNTQNAWHTFRAGRQDFLVLTCEFGPRNKVVEWMNVVVRNHPYHRVILVLHAYLASGSARYNWALSPTSMNPHSYGVASAPDGVNDGEELWQKLVSRHENFCLVCCGHAGRGYRTVTGVHGNRVLEMLYNTQELANGGDGWIRLLEFYPDGRTVQARTCQTSVEFWDQTSAGSFVFSMSPVSSADSDADGIPDYYEVQHRWDPDSPSNATADPDHDGCTNIEEYAACTSPVEESSVLRINAISSTGVDGGVMLEWQSVPGVRYQVQRSMSPRGGSWSAAGPGVTASDFSSALTVSRSGQREFFRVAVVP